MTDENPDRLQQVAKEQKPAKREARKKEAKKQEEQKPVIRQSHLSEMVVIKKSKDNE